MNRNITVQECRNNRNVPCDATNAEKRNIARLIKISAIFIVALFFTTIKTLAQTYPKQITVAQDGSGNYKTIQEAIDAVRAYSIEHVTINIKNGTYHEKIVVPASVTNVSFIGESRENTIISNNDYSGKFMSADIVNSKKKFGTFNSYTMHVQGNDITIEDLTIKNDAGPVGQAVALHVDGDRFVIKNCNIISNQDTLLTANDSSRQYYKDCYIEGTTDFIFGNATAVFQNCTIKSLKNSYVTAASTLQRQQYGYVFFNCKLIAADAITKVYLGRPWRPYARVVYINCELGKHIAPEGWHNWNTMENNLTAYYAEYGNTGEGAAIDKRISWSRQLTKEEAAGYTLENIFN